VELSDSQARPLPLLYAVADAEVCARAGWDLVAFAAACADGGARFIQIRGKSLPASALLDAALAIVARAGRGVTVVVNDRADIARLASAAGVHVGQEDLPPALARQIVGERALVGLSTHTVEQIDRAVGEPIGYLAVGPVFGTATKETGYEAVGLERVGYAAERTAESRLPLVAIGGITLANARSVIAAGAHSVAVISDLLATGDPRTRVQQYLDILS
jgi:thiamine-phosphate pyrophosphorylase